MVGAVGREGRVVAAAPIVFVSGAWAAHLLTILFDGLGFGFRR